MKSYKGTLTECKNLRGYYVDSWLDRDKYERNFVKEVNKQKKSEKKLVWDVSRMKVFPENETIY